MPASGREISEVSGRETSAATATTGSPWSRASSDLGLVGDREVGAAGGDLRIGAEGSDGTWGSTSSPASSK